MPEESGDISLGWVAVGNSIKNRRHKLRMSRDRLAELSGIRLSTIKEIEKHTKVRERREDTLVKISSALELEKSHLDDVLEGRRPEYPVAQPRTELRVDSLRDVLDDMSARISAIEKYLRSDVPVDKRLSDIETRLSSLSLLPDILHLVSGPEESVDAGSDGPEDTPDSELRDRRRRGLGDGRRQANAAKGVAAATCSSRPTSSS